MKRKMIRLPFAERQRTVEAGVLKCIKYDAECMGSYKRLVLQYWTLVDRLFSYDAQTGVFSIQQARIHLLTSPESIDRARRKLIENKVLQYSEKDRTKMEQYEKEYRTYHSPKNAVEYYREGMINWKEE
jgi:hypothetical protein